MEQINLNSGQVQVIGPHGSIYLYTHDNAKTLVGTVHEALSRRERWDDPDYLTRIIFCAMVPPDEWHSTKGFGIGVQYYVDSNLLITIDIQERWITISSYGSGVDNVRMDIEDFVANFYNSAQF